jgi:hypothetical protein
VNAWLLADALREHAGDARDFALALDAAATQQIVPWYEAQRLQDADATAVGDLQRRGGDPFRHERADGSVDPEPYVRAVVRDGLIPALGEDAVVLRASCVTALFGAPGEIFQRPEIFSRARQLRPPQGAQGPSPMGPRATLMIACLNGRPSLIRHSSSEEESAGVGGGEMARRSFASGHFDVEEVSRPRPVPL